MAKLLSHEVENKLNQIAAISIEALQLSSATELKEFCRGIVPGYSRLRKDEMLEELIKVTQSRRDGISKEKEIKQLERLEQVEEELIKKYEERLSVEQVAEIKTLPESALTPLTWGGNKSVDDKHPINIGVRYYQKIKDIVTESKLISKVNLNEADKKKPVAEKLNLEVRLGSLAAKLASFEMAFYPNIKTRRNRKRDYLKAIEACLQKDKEIQYPEIMRYAVNAFKTMMHSAFSDEVKELNQKYKEEVIENNKDRKEVDASKLFSNALEVLNNLSRYKWTEVVIALALVTGRRPCEIMCSGYFNPIDSNTFKFKGQAKRRANFDPNEELTIPVLADTQLVIKAINYLDSIGRRYPYNPQDHTGSNAYCDKKTSKELSRAYETKDFTSKDNRAIYGQLTYQIFADKNAMSESAWFQQVLGHGENQLATAATYIRYYIPSDQLEVLKEQVLG